MFKMMRRWLTYVLFTGCLLIILVVLIFNPDTQRQTKLTLSDWDEFASQIAQLNNINDFKQILKPILVERVVGTPNHELVKDYIANELRKLNWNVELDSFKDVTPNKGTLEFTNIIATSDSSVSRHLVLACHYDSKLMKFVFIAATDSAVPCAMLLYMAKTLNSSLQNLKSPVGLKLIFFDGEEAFVSWTAKDSVYGARHLASLMEARSSINQIELLVLLDLIGDSSPQFYSYFSNTHHWYKSLVNIERRLKTRNLLESEKSTKYYFVNNKFFGAGIQDDHEPFLIRGVPVLHIIPFPFPGVWHTEFDNESVINYKTVKNLMLIFELFIMQYLSESNSTK